MCGITGIVDYSLNPNTSPQLLTQMTNVIEHRGPDAGEIWQSENRVCGLGHRRLSIIDLSNAGTQPMTTQDGRFTIVFNGEIYNYLDIKQELLNKGVKFQSNSDTEVLLYGYQYFGKDIIDRLVGMWSFAIWDDREKELFCLPR